MWIEREIVIFNEYFPQLGKMRPAKYAFIPRFL